MLRPRLKCSVEVVDTGDGDLYLLRPSAGSDFIIEDAGPAVRAILDRLDGCTSMDELESAMGRGPVADVVEPLSRSMLLEDAADDDEVPPRERARFDRQLRYLSDLGTESASHYQGRLHKSHVLILGLGGLGSWAGYALASCGIGQLTLIDGDDVELSNLNRQVLYRERDIGKPKAAAAAHTLGQFNSSMRIRACTERLGDVAAVAAAVEGADFVVNAADWPAHDIERWVNEACVEAKIPFITMSHSPPVARVGPLYVPGKTGCFGCQEQRYRREFPLYDEIVAARRGRPSEAATLGPVCAFVGGQVALEVFHFLTRVCRPATLGRAYLYDLRTMGITTEAVSREEDCPVCRPGAMAASAARGRLSARKRS